MLRFPRTISFKPIERDAEALRGFKLSDAERLQVLLEQDLARRIAGPSQFGSLVIVFDADFVGMAALPSERDAILLVDANAMATGVTALQAFQAIASGNREILELGGSVEQFQLPLSASPEVTRDSSSGTSISFPEQIRGRLANTARVLSAVTHSSTSAHSATQAARTRRCLRYPTRRTAPTIFLSRRRESRSAWCRTRPGRWRK